MKCRKISKSMKGDICCRNEPALYANNTVTYDIVNGWFEELYRGYFREYVISRNARKKFHQYNKHKAYDTQNKF